MYFEGTIIIAINFGDAKSLYNIMLCSLEHKNRNYKTKNCL